jgi:hypothetical protein
MEWFHEKCKEGATANGIVLWEKAVKIATQLSINNYVESNSSQTISNNNMLCTGPCLGKIKGVDSGAVNY